MKLLHLRKRLPGGRWLLPVLALVVLVQCGKDSSTTKPEVTPVTALAEPENALSEALMVSLGQARNYHHKADLLLSAGKIEEAIASVEAVLAISFPPEAPESEDVRSDTHARLAKLHIRQGQLRKAMSLVDKGIAMSTRQSFFLANLHTVRGEVFETMANAAEANSEAAKQATIDAISAFDASIKINEGLLKKLGARQSQ